MISPRSSALALFLVLAWSPAVADVVTLVPMKDNTLFESLAGSFSNGRGSGMFVGRTEEDDPDPPFARRALLAFDVASSVPAGAVIDSVLLTLTMTRAKSGTDQWIALHPILSDWGEGESNAGPTHDDHGAQAHVGDVTWIHTFFNTGFWSTLGGSFDSAPSATTMVGDVGSYTWRSTPEMVMDVQGWLDSPSSNFGWLLKGDETGEGTAKRFATRESATLEHRPQLVIHFTPDMVPVEPTSWGAIKALYR